MPYRCALSKRNPYLAVDRLTVLWYFCTVNLIRSRLWRSINIFTDLLTYHYWLSYVVLRVKFGRRPVCQCNVSIFRFYTKNGVNRRRSIQQLINFHSKNLSKKPRPTGGGRKIYDYMHIHVCVTPKQHIIHYTVAQAGTEDGVDHTHSCRQVRSW